NVGGRVAGVASAFGRFIVNALMVALFTFYLLADGPKLRRRVFSVFPPERQPEVIRIWELAIEKTGGYVYSRLVLAIASGVFTSVALSVIGVRHALALGIWVGVVSQFVPAVGTYIASVVPLFVAFVDDPTKALWVLIVLVAYQQVENLLIAPRVTARTMSLHPAVGFGAAIAGILILGALGAFIALPAAAIIQAFVSAYLDQHPVVANRLIDDDRYEEWTLAAEAEVEAPSQRRSEQAGDDAGNPST
ncbi:MAG: AI-2E family transporter, partial [Acidimicrobiia bacterium]|nr:AI-2E family transporter [Acidimicrobiia bacterium]